MGKNVIAFNKQLSKPRSFWKDFFTQGGPLSKTMNLFPGMNATGGLHDFWMNNLSYNMVTNVATMLPAAAVTYGSLLGGAHASMTIPIHTALSQADRF